MKKTLIIVSSLLLGAAGAYAQGSINWFDSQSGTYLIEILSPSTGTAATTEMTGQTTYDEPSGTTVYTGGYIGGATTGNGPGIGPTPTSGYDGINYQSSNLFTAGLYLATSKAALTTAITTGSPVATTFLEGGANDGLYNTTVPTYVSSLV